MNKTWHNKERTEERRIEAGLNRLKLPFRKRADAVWFLLFYSAVFVFLIWWLFGVLLGHRFGFFDPPPIQTIKDSRILVNIQDDIQEKPLLDAVYHPPEQSLYISQQGGRIHRYSPATGLWKTENLLTDLLQLRSGNGNDPLSNHKIANWDDDSLWGLTEGNGLIRRKDKIWKIIKSNSIFMGSNQKPVAAGQLTTAAVSSNKQWLVVGTLKDGFGIYHLKTGLWKQVLKNQYDLLPSQRINHVAWSRGLFWLGSPKGLISLDIGTDVPDVQRVPHLVGEVLDMDVDEKDRLWVLERRNCRSGKVKCMRLSRFSGSITQREALVEEIDIYANLDFQDLHFANYWPSEQRLLVAGSAGLYSYNTNNHQWSRHFGSSVQDVLLFPKGKKGFYFGFTGGIGIISNNLKPWEIKNNQAHSWRLPDGNTNEKLISLRHGVGEEVLALGHTGKVFALAPNRREKNIQLVFSGSNSRLQAKDFNSAISYGDTVLFIGSKNAMVHNIVTRSYRDLSLGALPPWLKLPELQMISSGAMVYTTARKKGYTNVYRTSLRDAEMGNFNRTILIAAIPGPIGRIRDWNGQGIGVMATPSDGRIFRFASGKEELIGSGAFGMGKLELLDAAPFQKGIIVATKLGLRPYDYQSRGWGKYLRDYENVSPKEVVACQNRLFIMTKRGELLELEKSFRFTDLINSENSFNMNDNQFSDILKYGKIFFLAGNGWVHRYDTELRSIVSSWQLPGKGNIKLIGVVSGRPLMVSSGIAYVGSQTLEPRAGRIVNISIDEQYIWTVRRKEIQGQRATLYLKRYLKSNPFSLSTRCYFYNPFSGNGTNRVTDAVKLHGDSDRIAVATNRGLRFYSSSSRSWHLKINGDPMPRGGRLHQLNNFLWLAEPRNDGYMLTDIDTNHLRFPSGCSQEPVYIRKVPKKVTAYTVDATSNKIATIDLKGSVNLGWHVTQLEAPGEEPYSNALKRVYIRAKQTDDDDDDYEDETSIKKTANDNEGFLTFVPDYGRNILRYDLEKRSWITIPLMQLPGNSNIADINCEMGQYHELVTVKTEKGSFYLTSIDAISPTSPTHKIGVEMKHLFTPQEHFNGSGTDVQDVQMRGNEGWTFLLNNGIKYYNPVNRQWSQNVSIIGIQDSAQFYQWQDRGIVVSQDLQTWWVARQRGPQPLDFLRFSHTPGQKVALDDKGTIWQLHHDGKLYRLQQSQADNSNDYRDPQVAYERPFEIASQKILNAYEWGRRIIFDTDDGLRVLDTILRRELLIPDSIDTSEGIKEILSQGNQVWIRTQGDRLLFLTFAQVRETRLEGRFLPGTVSDLVSRVEQLRGRAFPSPPLLTDKWPQLKRHMVRLPNNVEVYDPIIAFASDDSGQLMAKRSSGQELLAPIGTFNISDPANLPLALDVGWLKWDRENKRFNVQSTNSVMEMSREDFILGGSFIFEDVNAVLAMGPKRLYAANRHGIFSFAQENLNLNDRSIRFEPMQWSQPQGAAHGCFITAEKIYKIDTDGNAVPQSNEWHRVRFGDVIITENIRTRSLTGRIDGRLNAFARKGFSWDQNKRGLAFIRVNDNKPSHTTTENDDEEQNLSLLVHSDAGIHRLNGYTGFETIPGENTRTSHQGRLYSLRADEIYFNRGNTWFKRQSKNNWSRVSDPINTRSLVDDRTWTWALKKGKLDVRLKGDSYQFKPVWSNDGLSFSSDRLKDAISINKQLIIISNAFLEMTDENDSSQLMVFQAPRYKGPSVPITNLQVLRNPNSQPFIRDDLLMQSGKRQYLWKMDQYLFEPINPSGGPVQLGLIFNFPANNPMLRFTRINKADGAQRIKKEFRVQDITGKQQWISFNFSNGRFPFDAVTSIAAAEDSLYVGTQSGLQIYSDNLSTSLENMKGCLQLGTDGSNKFTKIETVGIPYDRQDTIVAYGGGLCIEKPIGGSFRTCSSTKPLTRRWRYGGKDTFWNFFNNRGKLEVRYKVGSAGFTATPVTMRFGRFPHDNIRDFIIYNRQVFTIWKNGWMSFYIDGSMDLKPEGQVINYNTRAMAPLRFIEVKQDTRYSGATATKGLYFEGVGNRLWYYTGTSGNMWQEIKNRNIVTGLLNQSRVPYIVNRKRLRLVAPRNSSRSGRRIRGGRQSFSFQYRTLQGEWQPLSWKKDRLEIDKWSQFCTIDGTLWAATPQGLVRFARTPGRPGEMDGISLDPDQLMIIKEPIIKNKIPIITDIDVDGNQMTVRCEGNSEQVFQGDLDGQKENGIFKPVNTRAEEGGIDPFNKKVLISNQESGFWEWIRQGRTQFDPGRLSGKLHGQEVQLVGGRFSFDTINSISFYQDNRVEIGTDSGGWYYGQGGEIDIPSLRRAKVSGLNVLTVKEVRSSTDSEGERFLGLRTGGRQFVRIDKEGIVGKTSQFLQFLASDGFWRYMQDNSGSSLIISAGKSTGSSGQVKRQLENGRFSDDIVLGLPASGTDISGNYLLLPTGAGIVKLNTQLSPIDIFIARAGSSATGASGQDQTASSVVYMDTGSNQPYYLNGSQFHPLPLSNVSAALLHPFQLKLNMPAGARVLSVEDGPQDFMRVNWQSQTRRGWTLINPSDNSRIEEFNTVYVNISNFTKYISNRDQWGSIPPWLRVHLKPSETEFLIFNSLQPYRLALPRETNIHSAIIDQKRLILIGKTHLWEINLEKAMESAKAAANN
jgi:hypothetical protein